MRITPTTELPIGSIVRIDGRGIGRIVQSRQTTDQHNNPIVVHTVKYNSSGATKETNYSFIDTISSSKGE